ncbi:MAG: FKBP-type peptidyl-prolyl cis-trans isomerase [Calditrichaeota bacterium]|nr:MAG: FKBP-type peptidyl-prolyl cis-trans isomerase [Calditrichota bacterium]
MKAVIFFFFVLGLSSCQDNSIKEVKKLDTFEQKYSYALGLDAGEQFMNRMPLEIDVDALIQGILDTTRANRTVLMDKNETAQVLREFNTKAREAFQKKQAEKAALKDSVAANNLKEGREFLAKNKSEDDVITTESGLQYMVLEQGDGPKPSRSNTVKVHYRGPLLNGNEFDSSYKRGNPIEFQVSGVIPGWTEALQLMNVGSKYKLFIPSELAYGARGSGADIGPNATLIFEVELLEIK